MDPHSHNYSPTPRLASLTPRPPAAPAPYVPIDGEYRPASRWVAVRFADAEGRVHTRQVAARRCRDAQGALPRTDLVPEVAMFVAMLDELALYAIEAKAALRRGLDALLVSAPESLPTFAEGTE